MPSFDYFQAPPRSNLRERQKAGVSALMGPAEDLTPTIPLPMALKELPPTPFFTPSKQPVLSRDRKALDERAQRTGACSSDCIIRARRAVLIVLVVISLTAAVWAWYELRPQPLLVLMVSVASFNLAVGVAEARWRLHAWRTPEANEHIGWPEPVSPEKSAMSFSLIVAARDEAEVIADTLRGLVRQRHPHCEIIVSLCDDDNGTVAAARESVANNTRTVSG